MNLNCDRCKCRNRAYPNLPIGIPIYKEVDIYCPKIKLSRTEDADYYWCELGGPPPKPGGWHPGRGY